MIRPQRLAEYIGNQAFLGTAVTPEPTGPLHSVKWETDR